jgi:hypothetical protein
MARKFLAIFIIAATYIVVTLSWLASLNQLFIFNALPGESFYLQIPIDQAPDPSKKKK